MLRFFLLSYFTSEDDARTIFFNASNEQSALAWAKNFCKNYNCTLIKLVETDDTFKL